MLAPLTGLLLGFRSIDEDQGGEERDARTLQSRRISLLPASAVDAFAVQPPALTSGLPLAEDGRIRKEESR